MNTWVPMGNAFCWLFVQLIGGWRRVIGWCFLYAGTLIACWIFWARMAVEDGMLSAASQALNFLSYAQMGILLLGGLSAIGRTISRDQRSKMFESHRLSPVSDAGVVIGYLLGPTLQFLAAFLIGVIFGVVLCGIGRFSPKDWLLGSGFLLLTALQIWSFVIFSGLIFPKGGNPSGVMMGLGFLSFLWMAAFPGAGLLLGLYSAFYSQLLMTDRPGTGPPAIGGMLAFTCALMTAVWLMAAARKFRRPDLPAFDAARGMLLLVLWLAASVVGIVAFSAIPTGPFRSEQLLVLHATAFALGSLGLGIFPLNAAIHARVRSLRGGEPYDFTDRIPAWLVIACMIPLIVGSLSALEWYFATQASELYLLVSSPMAALVNTAITLFLAFVTLDGLLRLQVRLRSMVMFMFIFIALVWCPAPGIDFYLANVKVEMGMVDTDEKLPLTWLFGCSPIGSLIAIWGDRGIPLIPGFAFQTAVALAAQALGWRFLQVERERRAEEQKLEVTKAIPT